MANKKATTSAPSAASAPSASKPRKTREPSREPICENLRFASKEAFKRLRTNVVMSFAEGEDVCRVIGVTSAQPSEGKSTISLNLAYSLAELGKRVLLVDADMRHPSINIKIGTARSPGLSNLLGDTNSISAAMQEYRSSTDETSFDIVPGGDIPQNPTELLNSHRMERLLTALRSAYDYIIIDLPPVGAVIDAVTLANQTDGMLVVMRENNCPRGVLSDCIDQLNFAHVNILGFVVNGAMEGSGKKYRYGSKYKYGYGYGSYYYK